MEHPYLVTIAYIASQIYSCGLTRAWELMSREGAPVPIREGSKYTRWVAEEVIAYANTMPRGTRPCVVSRRTFRDGKPVQDAA